MIRLALGLLLLTPIAQDEKKSPPKSKVLAIRGAKVYTVSGAVIENAVLLVENGKITDIGADVKVPEGAETLDLTGKVIIPGIVDAGSRILTDGSDFWSGGSPEHDIHDLLNPYGEDHKEAVQSGVTTVCILPMQRGGISGQGVILRPGADRSKWILKRNACLRLSLGTGGADSSTSLQRYEQYRQIKASFDGAKTYRETWEKYRKDFAEYQQKKKAWDDARKKPKTDAKPEDKKEEEPKKPQKPRVDPRNEVLVKAMDPKTPLLVRIEAHTPDTIEWALALADEFKLKIVIDQGTEAARVGEALAKAKVPVIVGPLFRYGFRRVDYLRHSPDSAALLAKAGVTVAIGSFPDPAAGHSGSGASRFLLEAAALASSKGLSRELALRAVTLEPAKIMGVDAAVGSIEKGKIADLVVLSGEPFGATTKVERTMCDGAWIYERKETP